MKDYWIAKAELNFAMLSTRFIKQTRIMDLWYVEKETRRKIEQEKMVL